MASVDIPVSRPHTYDSAVNLNYIINF